jgi:hypothetical protein
MGKIMEVAVFFVIWLALCFAVGFYAEHKGRSGVGLFFLSFFLGPLVGFVAALDMQTNEKKVAAGQRGAAATKHVGPNGVRPWGERRSPLRDVSKSSRDNNVPQTSATGQEAMPPVR